MGEGSRPAPGPVPTQHPPMGVWHARVLVQRRYSVIPSSVERVLQPQPQKWRLQLWHRNPLQAPPTTTTKVPPSTTVRPQTTKPTYGKHTTQRHWFIYMYMSAILYVCMHVCLYICMYVCMHVVLRTYVRMYVCVYVCIYVLTYKVTHTRMYAYMLDIFACMNVFIYNTCLYVCM